MTLASALRHVRRHQKTAVSIVLYSRFETKIASPANVSAFVHPDSRHQSPDTASQLTKTAPTARRDSRKSEKHSTQRTGGTTTFDLKTARSSCRSSSSGGRTT